MEKGVILATPTTLIALLKAVAYSWKQKKSYENAAQIRNLGKELFARLCNMSSNINQLGRDIEKCASTFNRTVGSMESRVMISAKKLGDLEVSSLELDDIRSIDEEKTFTRQFNRRYEDDV